LRIWNEHGAEVDLLLTDIVMPGGMSGWQLADQLRKLKPELRVIFATGFSPDNRALRPGSQLLPKPYFMKDLFNAVRQGLDPEHAS
jgi:CheY-like chemotaxis protein